MRPTGRLLTAVLIVAASTSVIGPRAIAQQDDARRSYLAGNGFLSRGMNELAVNEYRSFLAESPEHADAPTASYGLGVALHRLGKNEEAIIALDGLGDLPGFRFADESRIVAATAEFSLKRFDAVVDRLSAGIGSIDGNALAACAPLLIESLHLLDDHQRAVNTTSAIISRSGIDSLGARGLCFAALSAERIDEEALTMEWASWVAQQGGDETLVPIASMCVARLLLADGDADGAGAIAARIAREGPAQLRSDALRVVAQALTAQGRMTEADRALAQLQHESDETSDSVLIQRGVIAFENEQYEQALRFFLGCDTSDESVARWAAKCESRMGRHARAAERLASIENPGAETLYELAVAQSEAGQTDRAADSFERFLDEGPSDSSLRSHAELALATIEHGQGAYAKSAARCRALLENRSTTGTPLLPRARLLLAENLYLGNDLEGAKSAFKQCIDADPGSESTRNAMYRLGMISAQLGEHATAETLLKSVTRGNTTAPEFAPGLRTLGDLAMAKEDWNAAIASHRAYLASDSADDPAPTLLKLGISLSRLGQDALALDALSQAIELGLEQPLQARAYLERGETKSALDDRDGAASDWTQAKRIGSDTEIATTAGLRLASLTMTGGDTDAAQEHLQAVIGSTSDSATRAVASLDLGRLQLQSQDHQAAVRTFGLVETELLPAHRRAEYHAAFAIAASRSGEDQRAHQEDRAFEQEHSSVDDSLLTALLYERAWRHRRMNDHAGALAAYDELILNAPGEAIASSARIESAELLVESGEIALATEHLRAVIETAEQGSPLLTDAALRLGNLSFNAGEYAEAAEAFARMLEQSDPDDRSLDRTRLLCGESNHYLNLWATALPFYSVASRSEDPAIAEPALLRLGSCAAELQRWSVSESAYQQHIERFASSDRRVLALFGVGWAKEASGDPGSAIDSYRKAAQGSTETAARAQFQIGECLFAMGEHEQATSEFIKVDILFSSPKWSAAALYEAGRCFEAIGDRDQAAQQWQRVLEIDSGGTWSEMARARLGDTDQPVLTNESQPDSITNNID